MHDEITLYFSFKRNRLEVEVLISFTILPSYSKQIHYLYTKHSHDYDDGDDHGDDGGHLLQPLSLLQQYEVVLSQLQLEAGNENLSR